MDNTVSKRRILRSGVTTFAVGLTGCFHTEDDYRSLIAVCLPCSDSPDECSNEPIPSDEEPIVSNETINMLLDRAVEEIDFSECEPTGIRRGSSLIRDDNWEEVAATYESLPHGDILHEGYVIRTEYFDEEPKE